MNENLNLCEILKGHEGEIFYSPIYGDVRLIGINETFDNYPIVTVNVNSSLCTFTKLGKYGNYETGECLLFPSKDQRDWNKWIEEQEPKPPYDACKYTDCEQCSFKTSCLYLKEQKPKVPKTWSEFIKYNNKLKPYAALINIDGYSIADAPIEKSALALFKIHQLIEVGYGGNVNDWEWKDRSITKWRIGFDYDGEIMIDYCVSPIAYTPIAFHTKEQAKEFLKYTENIQLLKDYFMID